LFLQYLAAGKIGQEGGLLRRGLEVMAKGRISCIADQVETCPRLFAALVVGGLCHGKAATTQDAKWLFQAIMWHVPGKASVEEEIDQLLNIIFELAPKRCRLFLLEALAFKVGLLSNHDTFEFIGHFL
jgi:hypothetical protein